MTAGGYERLTMAAVARRAGSSKESLYVWFGSKEGMVAELIRRQSARTNAAVEAALATEALPHLLLAGIARNLLDLLVSDVSLALNRAAMSSPELAAILLQHGRHTTGPLVEGYLAGLHREGHLTVPDPADAFRLLYGLTIADTQIRALLGEAPPDADEREGLSQAAVRRFLQFAGAGQEPAAG